MNTTTLLGIGLALTTGIVIWYALRGRHMTDAPADETQNDRAERISNAAISAVRHDGIYRHTGRDIALWMGAGLAGMTASLIVLDAKMGVTILIAGPIAVLCFIAGMAPALFIIIRAVARDKPHYALIFAILGVVLLIGMWNSVVVPEWHNFGHTLNTPGDPLHWPLLGIIGVTAIVLMTFLTVKGHIWRNAHDTSETRQSGMMPDAQLVPDGAAQAAVRRAAQRTPRAKTPVHAMWDNMTADAQRDDWVN